jgi:hypothetical protein
MKSADQVPIKLSGSKPVSTSGFPGRGRVQIIINTYCTLTVWSGGVSLRKSRHALIGAR